MTLQITHTFVVGECYYRQWDALPIYGEIVEPEYDEDREMCRRQHLLIHRGYSILEPDGEYGTMYETQDVQEFRPISRDAFVLARSLHWQPRLSHAAPPNDAETPA